MKIAIFDIDNTLTESRSVISQANAKLLSDLIDLIPVAIISGESLESFEYQVTSHLTHTKKDHLYVLPTAGAKLCVSENGAWREIYSVHLGDDKRRKILQELAKVLDITPLALGHLIEDRGTLITYAALGKDAPLELKYAWDPSREKRKAIIEKLAPRLPGVSMQFGGSTSIDFTEEGIGKAYGVEKLLQFLNINPADAVYVGDALDSGGNDSPVKETGVKTVATTSPEVTRGIIMDFIKEAKDIAAAFMQKLRPKTVAYFCCEYGVEDSLPLYAGGLGILAGDFIREAGRRDAMRFVGFGLIARSGMRTVGTESRDYSKKIAEAGFEKVMIGGKLLTVSFPVAEGKNLSVCAWEKSYGSARLYLLDTNLPQNDPRDRTVADYLYNFEMRPRVYQEMVLGISAVKFLRELGIDPDTYHFNEGHAGFGALGALLENGAENESVGAKIDRIRERLVATKHTILSGAGTYLSRKEFEDYVAPYIRSKGANAEDVFNIGALERDKGTFSAAKFLLSICVRENGVSASHVASELKQYPQSRLINITNGVDISHWQYPALKGFIGKSGEGSLFEIKKSLRGELIRFVNREAGSNLREDCLTLVWARRFAAYKRPGLLFNDEAALLALVTDEKTPLQIIIAGKVHATDREGVRTLDRVKRVVANPAFKGKIVYIPDYSIESAKMLVAGADIWLNTPIPGFEACGTSGMKAGLNGTILMSTNDGWVAEVPELVTIGRIIPEDDINHALYTIIGEMVARFYEGPDAGKSAAWLSNMRKTIELVEKRFSAARMVDDYAEKLYHWNS